MSFLENLFKKKSGAKSGSAPEMLTGVFETMREAVMFVAADTGILASNKAAYNAFARGNGDLPGKRLTEVIRASSVHEAFRQALDEGKSSEVEFDFLTPEKMTYAVRVAPVELDGRRSAIGIFYDLTTIERLERVRQEFFSNISHELRTPLTSIIAYVETLEDGAIEDEANNRRFLGIIRRNARRMHHLIDDILELSSIEAGKISIQPKSVNLHALVNEVFASLSARLEEKKIKAENQVSPEARVTADVVRLEQILTNLIDNAIKFNRERGTITVTHERKADRDFAHITDTGEGISAEHLERIFERFYRTDRARSREIGGTGLGLAIVKHLARLHGGEVSAASTLGKGSVFTIELPAEIEPQ